MWSSACFVCGNSLPNSTQAMEKLNKQQVAERLQISVRKLEKMVTDREFPPAVRIGKQCLWSERVVQQYEQSLFSAQEAWRAAMPTVILPTP